MPLWQMQGSGSSLEQLQSLAQCHCCAAEQHFQLLAPRKGSLEVCQAQVSEVRVH